jgi:hypothetical protein
MSFVEKDRFRTVLPGLVPSIHVFKIGLKNKKRGWPGAQTSVRSLRKADYYARP